MKRPDMERVTQMVQQGNEEKITLHGKKRNIYESNNAILVNCQNVRKLEFLQIVSKGKNWCSHFRNNLAEFSDTKHKTNL